MFKICEKIDTTESACSSQKSDTGPLWYMQAYYKCPFYFWLVGIENPFVHQQGSFFSVSLHIVLDSNSSATWKRPHMDVLNVLWLYDLGVDCRFLNVMDTVVTRQ